MLLSIKKGRLVQVLNSQLETQQLRLLTFSPQNKVSSAKFLVCLNIQNASMSIKVGGYVVQVSNSLDSDETPSYSPSHPDPSCLHMGLWLCLAR